MFSSSEKLALNWLANRRALARVGNTEQTNLYKTAYAYSNLSYGRQVIRTEQTYSGGWNDDNMVTYTWDSLSRQEFEQRDDWDSGAMPPAWATRYDVTQEYDKMRITSRDACATQVSNSFPAARSLL